MSVSRLTLEKKKKKKVTKFIRFNEGVDMYICIYVYVFG